MEAISAKCISWVTDCKENPITFGWIYNVSHKLQSVLPKCSQVHVLSSLRDFGPCVIGLFLYGDFWKMIFWLVLKLEISCRVIISWRILVSFRGFFEDYIFAWWNMSFHNSSFAIIYFFNVNGKATVRHTFCFITEPGIGFFL